MPFILLSTATSSPGSAKPSAHFRGDVEGLRAVAIGLVLLYHAGLSFIPGGYVGVDVFFVISGFLITTQLALELEKTGQISLPGFYSRRAKRLLPAACVVLVTTVILAWLFTPRNRWGEIGGDVAAAALYFVNWRLANRSVDYLAEDSEASPVQHFWSLAVEEQFYILWPLLISAAALIARSTRRQVKPFLWLGIAIVALASFRWSLAMTSRSPEEAFFVTTTRVWELSIGAVVSLAAGLLPRVPRWCAVLLGWSGLAAIISSGVFFTNHTRWPGYAATLPTLGAAAVLAAGFSAGRAGPARVLETRPLQWIGRLSYSLYLWHWPLLAVAASSTDQLSTSDRVALIAGSIVLSWLTFHAIENPFRYGAAISRSPALGLSFGAGFTLLGLAAGLALRTAFSRELAKMDGGERGAPLGAAVLRPEPRDDPAGSPVDHVSWMTPEPLRAAEDLPDVYQRGCQQSPRSSEILACEYGDRQSQTKLALVGDSKLAQWIPALQELAERNEWHMVSYTKSACSFTMAMVDINGEKYTSCHEWSRALLDRLVSEPPDYVLTSQGNATALDERGQPSVEEMVLGLQTTWAALTAKGSKVVVIADNPYPGRHVYKCVDQHRQRLSACTYRRELYSESAAPTQHLAVRGQPGVEIVDLFDAICPTERCAPVIGNVLIYRQGSHLTATYVKTLAPRLARALSKVGLPARF